MKNVLKFELFFKCLVFLCCFGITTLTHGQAVISVDPPEKSSPGVGSQLEINLKISGGRNVVGYEVGVTFDPTALQHAFSTNGDYLPDALFSASPVSEGKIVLTASGIAAAEASSGILATMIFSVVAVKASTLELTGASTWDVNGAVVSVSVRNGAVVAGQVSMQGEGNNRGAAGDVNGDGRVNVLDLARVASRLRSRDAGADVNGDGMVNVLDLVAVAQRLGASTGGGVPVSRDVVPEGMVLIPAGEFRMGSNSGDSDEKPVHSVYVDAFYMDKYEVTNLDFKKFVLANPQWQKKTSSAYLEDWRGNNYPSDKANHPVMYVTWQAAMAYATWKGKRLPTEAEWEKAARGGKSGMTYPWGNNIDSTRANYNKHIGDTTAVGTYAPNGYGLYDMAGNAWEWCLDRYNKDFYSISPARNPLSGANSVQWLLDNYMGLSPNRDHVLRGGSWNSSAQFLRVAKRRGRELAYANHIYGFRCVRSVSPEVDSFAATNPPTKSSAISAKSSAIGEVLIYTGEVWWITQKDATTQAQTTQRLLKAAGIQTEITEDKTHVKQWMLQTAQNGSVDVAIFYGPLPTTIYAPGNTQPNGSAIEKWIETSDGNMVLNHADWFGFWADGDVHRVHNDAEERREGLLGTQNGAAALQNIMDIPDITMWGNNTRMKVTDTGRALTPSLVDFASDRPFHLDKLQGAWFAEKIFASNTGDANGTRADPVIVRDGNRGRIAIVHQTDFEDNPKGKVAAEIIIWLSSK